MRLCDEINQAATKLQEKVKKNLDVQLGKIEDSKNYIFRETTRAEHFGLQMNPRSSKYIDDVESLQREYKRLCITQMKCPGLKSR